MDDAGLARAFAAIVNANSIENYTDTPDYVIGEYLVDCLKAYNRAVRRRERHADRPAPPAWMDRDRSEVDEIAADAGDAPQTLAAQPGEVRVLSIPSEWRTPMPRLVDDGPQDDPPDDRPPFTQPQRGHDL